MQTKIKGLGWANLNPGAAVEGNNYSTKLTTLLTTLVSELDIRENKLNFN